MDTPPLANAMDRLAALPPIWHVVWSGLLLLTVGLVVLSWTRWGQSKPMHKCAVLSLLAHVLLACLATTVQIVGTVAEPSSRATIHVALMSGEEGTTDEDAAAPQIQPWEGLKPGPVSRPELPDLERSLQQNSDAASFDLSEPTPVDASPVPPVALPAPELLVLSEADDPQSEAAPLPLDAAPIEEPRPTEAEPSPREPKPTRPDVGRLQRGEEAETQFLPLESLKQRRLDADRGEAKGLDPVPSPMPGAPLPPANDLPEMAAEPVTQNAADAVPVTTPLATPPNEEDNARLSTPPRARSTRPITPIQSPAESSGPAKAAVDKPSLYRHRHLHERSRLVQEHGGTEETEAAVERALQWLSRAQSLDGRWDAGRHGAGRELGVLGHDRQGAGAAADTGVTGLALLAYLGAGHTHQEGKHQEEVQKGLAFLVRVQDRDGALAGQAALYARMYCHAMAAFALSEAYAMTGDPALQEPVQRAITYTVNAQHVGGGWRYRPGDRGDTSQLGWQLMALRSAEIGGISVPDATWRRAEQFLAGVSRGRAGGLAAYQPTTGVSRPMSAEATYCKLLLADRIGRVEDLDDTCDETCDYLRLELPGMGRTNFYYWYYATLLFHLRQNSNPAAQQDWQTWNESLKQALLASQRRSGPLAGAWASDTMWGGYGGRVYTTALAALCLETYYRYLPFLGGSPRTARRPSLLHQEAFDSRSGADKID